MIELGQDEINGEGPTPLALDRRVRSVPSEESSKMDIRTRSRPAQPPDVLSNAQGSFFSNFSSLCMTGLSPVDFPSFALHF